MRGRSRREHEALAIISAGRRRSVAEGRFGTHPAPLRRSSQSHGGDRVSVGPRRGSALRRHVGTNRGGTRENRASHGCNTPVGAFQNDRGKIAYVDARF